MTDERTTPLRPGDPSRLGRYELIGRLGEGGMGTVYLARADGTLVAVKMVRADLASDDAFRRRFRSEVNRIRQVPPFCTAEILDADPDYEQPYLVVEYVDGPNLADVVAERGPLTAANLHGVAIGVATALTAIHGAGVIHRDLKPRNVLLAPGSPKVIDFGIARPMEATSGHTQTGEVVGTVAYMAPERFGDDTTLITPAADVFAWGGVVAYAGTGRTPFGADSPAATAARILTRPPDLAGLSGPLRDLVAHALEKDPANRPTARELLDLLVAGPRQPAPAAAALAHQPGLRVAAEEAQAATGYHSARQLTALAPQSELVGYTEDAIVTQPVPPSPVAPPTPFGHDPHPRRRWVLPAAVALLLVALLAAGGLTAKFWPRGGGGAAGGVAATTTPATESGQVVRGGAGNPPLLTDELRRPRLWQASNDRKEKATCSFRDGLVVRREKSGVYRCRGPLDAVPDDMRAEVGVRILTPDSCATIWLRFRGVQGYQVRVCERNVYIGTHKSADIQVLRTFPLDDAPLSVGGAPTKITLNVVGGMLEILRDGKPVGSVRLTDRDLTSGRVVLGIYTEQWAREDGPYEVAFSDITIW
ncbi:serine/threonine-protein kinase [Couchioplanes caeruleus]|uniref:Serine/threonine protein kinase n=2 Tax=Couchioplanes caeruleus TaxID=56438 RepID=A0A1K0F9N5_9ACTN|nr:serine/threonine-protein kinase [Couchioplanes caeruleus]OJF09448.1 serine/threonine protein kinase [Couchioplanes caeruleus subsp. caeruleus]ROP34179.1 serine/threonine protein kinase [Couchioplanes caeruleus]